MNIKSLLIGSAAAMVLTTGANAADAIVYADPEPMEYVRICDVYGAGFFYIPGTETCLKIGGYFRVQTNFDFDGASGYSTLSRFALRTDVRSETEWGTLRGYSSILFNYDTAALGSTFVESAYIELIGASGTLRVGRDDSAYTRFLGYGGLDIIDIAAYGTAYTTTEISYTFAGAGGFSAIIALVDNEQDTSWGTNVEGGVLFQQGWGSVGAVVGYDGVNEEWGASAALTGTFSAASAKLQVFYNSDLTGASDYTITGPGGATDWSVLGSVAATFTPTFGAAVTAQWFNEAGWLAGAELQFTPVENLAIVPGIVYSNFAGADAWGGAIRVQRSF